jgi:general secretion pathway protein A
VGTGKTTLLARVLHHLPSSRIQSSVIVNPTLTPSEFLEGVMLDFGFKRVPASKAQRIVELRDFLVKGSREGKISALIVDEAHKLSPEILEEIRLLGNFDYSDEKLLQVLLLGQTELHYLLEREDLRQFKQRIALRFSIQALSEADVSHYIRYRWAKAGGTVLPFSAEVLENIAAVSQGIPRVINVLCDNALMQAFGDGVNTVEPRHLAAVCSDLCLAKPQPRNHVAVASTLAAAQSPARVTELSGMRTLERYGAPPAKASLLARFAGKLGLSHRIETA